MPFGSVYTPRTKPASSRYAVCLYANFISWFVSCKSIFHESPTQKLLASTRGTIRLNFHLHSCKYQLPETDNPTKNSQSQRSFVLRNTTYDRIRFALIVLRVHTLHTKRCRARQWRISLIKRSFWPAWEMAVKRKKQKTRTTWKTRIVEYMVGFSGGFVCRVDKSVAVGSGNLEREGSGRRSKVVLFFKTFVCRRTRAVLAVIALGLSRGSHAFAYSPRCTRLCHLSAKTGAYSASEIACSRFVPCHACWQCWRIAHWKRAILDGQGWN